MLVKECFYACFIVSELTCVYCKSAARHACVLVRVLEQVLLDFFSAVFPLPFGKLLLVFFVTVFFVIEGRQPASLYQQQQQL